MHLLHRTIPFIAIAALVTVSPAGAQERDDSTSTAGAVVSLLGLGGNFAGFGSSSDDASHPVERPGALPIRVILGWREELMRRVPRP